MKNVICWIRRHKFESIKRYNHGNIEKVRCVRCKKYFFLNHSMGQILPWNANFEHGIEEMEGIIGNILGVIKEAVKSGEMEEGESMIIRIPKRYDHKEFEQGFKYKGAEQPNTKRYSN